MKNYYKTLGISQNASQEEIKKAYIQLAVRYHPDKNPRDNLSEQFKEINEAKQVLLNDLKKFNYDKLLVDFLARNGSLKFKAIRRKKGKSIYDLTKITLRKNRLILAILFSVTILVSAAFFQIPPDEPTSNSAGKELTIQPKKEPLEAKAVVLSSFVDDRKLMQKATVPNKTHSTEAVAATTKINKAKPLASTQKVPRNKNAVVSSAPVHYSSDSSKALQKQLDISEMAKILSDIRAEKQKFRSNSNCVQIVKTKNSNIRNAFMLANFLSNYGFVISGREKADTNGNGISINAGSNCIKVVLGKL